MSVEINAGFAYGYKLSADDVIKIQENLEVEVLEDLWDTYVIELNTWGDGRDGVVFGVQYVHIDEPGAAKIDELTELFEQRSSWSKEVKDVYAHNLAGILGDREPGHYLFYQVC